VEATGTLWDQKKARTRDDFVRAALVLFRRQGFERTTVDEISAAAGSSPRTFFRYFGAKEDILFDDLADHLAFLRERMAESLPRQGAWDGVIEAMIAVNTRLLSAGADLAVERFDAWLREPALRQRFAFHSLEWEDAIAEAVARSRGTRPTDDPYARTVGIVAVAGFRSAMETNRRNGFVEDLRALLDTIGDGLRHEPPTPRPPKPARK
jgi:AcrR family transcriptional regulator